MQGRLGVVEAGSHLVRVPGMDLLEREDPRVAAVGRRQARQARRRLDALGEEKRRAVLPVEHLADPPAADAEEATEREGRAQFCTTDDDDGKPVSGSHAPCASEPEHLAPARRAHARQPSGAELDPALGIVDGGEDREAPADVGLLELQHANGSTELQRPDGLLDRTVEVAVRGAVLGDAEVGDVHGPLDGRQGAQRA